MCVCMCVISLTLDAIKGGMGGPLGNAFSLGLTGLTIQIGLDTALVTEAG